MSPKIKYWDAAATTPVDSRVLKKMLPYFSEIFGNASSNHVYGKQAKNAIEEARKHVAAIINADPKEIYFTSGATEAINWALKGYLEANPEKGNHIITVKTEHKAVLNTCEYLETKGYEVTYLDVNENGLINLLDLEGAIQSNTALISVMYVNNEIGIIQDIQLIGEIARRNNIVFFCDATQAVGKIPVDVLKDQIDMLCFSSHKMNGPKGIGALFLRNGIKLNPLIHGGGQEKGLHGGTYNTPLIVGLGKACEIAHTEHELRLKETIKKRSEVFEILNNEELVENFKEARTVSNIISFTVINGDADEFLIKNSKMFVASVGSACTSHIMEISHVIKAIFPNELQNKIIRISI
jgi:cysteine desulfurase